MQKNPENIGDIPEPDVCMAEVSDKNGYSKILCRSRNGKSMIINAAPNTNLVFPLTRIPAIAFTIKTGITEIEDFIQTDFTTKTIRIGGGNCYEICPD